MLKRAAFAILLAGAAMTGACAPISSYSGFQAIEANPRDVKPGEDSKATVRGRLGSPSAVSAFDTNVWIYMNQIKETVAFMRPVVTRRDITVITFDQETETVKTVDNLTLADGKVIAFNGRETPTRGRELTVLEQLIGSIGAGGVLPRDEEGVPGSRPGDRR
ncbi:outer membrane protein assembly factor BamE [Phenylobacterium sp.]|uniref:outer membrane protein assembly factor BamE n=1 Tax=Phenylobacterium sp. TaxID=1871053 RepID=UPI0025FA4CF6|nr:outer membrane protein assembly factor BamE [Phenylobacterium sp.]MCA6226519.1 outer membrane protein assembly factor BamE [Phenylobacterium sp.]MCA6268445.1 outer membrane protein assembly factor BamE [Phenylobacterium sp.]MCA6315258.1 outer membrane protein assembly factor BamE [Phenylobacterium sp.]